MRYYPKCNTSSCLAGFNTKGNEVMNFCQPSCETNASVSLVGGTISSENTYCVKCHNDNSDNERLNTHLHDELNHKCHRRSLYQNTTKDGQCTRLANDMCMEC